MSQEAEALDAGTHEVEAPEAQTTDTFVSNGQEAMAEESQDVRPDWLPEKFETPEQLAHSYSDLERAFHSRRDELKYEIMNEMADEHDASVPESPGDYNMNITVGDQMIEVSDTPMADWFRSTAHKLGLGQDQFNEIIGEYLEVESMSGPNWEAESAILGEHADQRLERVDAWARSHLSDQAYEIFAQIPASAGMIMTFEELMELNGQPQFITDDTGHFQEELSIDDLKSMQNDPRYWKEKDPAFISKVQNGFKQHAMKKHGRL